MQTTHRDVAVRVWVDDQHPIFRRGLISCLHAEGCTVIGESAGLKPVPDFAGVDVLLFQADDGGLSRVLAATNGLALRLVGLSPRPTIQPRST